MTTLYDMLGVPKNADGRRDQEGVPQARARASPRRERRRRGEASRRSRAPTTCSPTRRSASSTTPFGVDERPRAGRAAAAAAVRGLRPRRPLRRPLRRRRGGGFGRQRAPQPERGADLEARRARSRSRTRSQGVQVRVPVEVETACHTCGGTGAEPGTAPIVCPQCGGRGVVSDSHGLFALSQPCPRCRGNGTVIEKPCKTCRGSGRERVQKTFQVKIPAGRQGRHADPAEGQRRAGPQRRPAGDLYVVDARRRSPLYERRGADLVVDVPVSLRGGGARRLGRGADAGRPDLAEGSRRLAARQAAEGQGPRRAEAEGRRQGRPARPPEADRAREGLEAGARAARAAAEGEPADGPTARAT